MDLIDGICKILECNYKFELVPDNNYGRYNPTTKEWNGLIKHLLDRVRFSHGNLHISPTHIPK